MIDMAGLIAQCKRMHTDAQHVIKAHRLKISYRSIMAICEKPEELLHTAAADVPDSIWFTTDIYTPTPEKSRVTVFCEWSEFVDGTTVKENVITIHSHIDIEEPADEDLVRRFVKIDTDVNTAKIDHMLE